MDKVVIDGLEVEAIVGIYPAERLVRQRVLVNLDMAFDTVLAASTNCIEHALDYKAVADRVSGLIVEAKFELLETMANTIADVVMREFGVRWLTVECYKPQAIKNVSRVGIKIIRGEI